MHIIRARKRAKFRSFFCAGILSSRRERAEEHKKTRISDEEREKARGWAAVAGPKASTDAPGNQLHSAAAGLLNRSERVRDRSGLPPRLRTVQAAFSRSCAERPAGRDRWRRSHIGRTKTPYGPDMVCRSVRVRSACAPEASPRAGSRRPRPGKYPPERSKMPRNGQKTSKNAPKCPE